MKWDDWRANTNCYKTLFSLLKIQLQIEEEDDEENETKWNIAASHTHKSFSEYATPQEIANMHIINTKTITIFIVNCFFPEHTHTSTDSSAMRITLPYMRTFYAQNQLHILHVKQINKQNAIMQMQQQRRWRRQHASRYDCFYYRIIAIVVSFIRFRSESLCVCVLCGCIEVTVYTHCVPYSIVFNYFIWVKTYWILPYEMQRIHVFDSHDIDESIRRKTHYTTTQIGEKVERNWREHPIAKKRLED